MLNEWLYIILIYFLFGEHGWLIDYDWYHDHNDILNDSLNVRKDYVYLLSEIIISITGLIEKKIISDTYEIGAVSTSSSESFSAAYAEI